MIRRLKAIAILSPIAIAVVGWSMLLRWLRPMVLGARMSAQAEELWWATIALLYFAIFLMGAIALKLVFRRYLERSCIVASLANLFTILLLSALSTITSDPIASPVLNRIGLASLSSAASWLALIWVPIFMYVLFTGIDRAQATSSSQRSS
jgi:hypothetical protein